MTPTTLDAAATVARIATHKTTLESLYLPWYTYPSTHVSQRTSCLCKYVVNKHGLHMVLVLLFLKHNDTIINVRGGPLEIPGGGVKIQKKQFVQRKMPGKKIRAAITSEKKKSCKQTAKCK